MRSEAQDRLSPLTSSSIPYLAVSASIEDPHADLEKFVDGNTMEATQSPMQEVRISIEFFVGQVY